MFVYLSGYVLAFLHTMKSFTFVSGQFHFLSAGSCTIFAFQTLEGNVEIRSSKLFVKEFIFNHSLRLFMLDFVLFFKTSILLSLV